MDLNKLRNILIDCQDELIRNNPAKARMEIHKAIHEIRAEKDNYVEVRKLHVIFNLLKNSIREHWYIKKHQECILEALDNAIGIVEDVMGFGRSPCKRNA